MKGLVISIAPWTLLIGGIIAAIALTTPASQTLAQQADAPCKAVMVLDRSSSVTPSQLNTMRTQIGRLFEPTGLYDDNIQLAFWSFAHEPNGAVNYDAPYHDFVSSKGVNAGFKAQLNSIVVSFWKFATTNYEQGFAYNRGAPNSYSGIKNIVSKADIIVFMTDGLPNMPSGQYDWFGNEQKGVEGNQVALDAGRNAVLKHKAAGKIIVGGIIGGTSKSSINFVVNGSKTNSSNIFPISGNYRDLAEKLKSVIGDSCKPIVTPPTPPPPPPKKYDLEPKVTAVTNTISKFNSSVKFDYWVANTKSDNSASTKWTVKKIVVSPGGNINKLRTFPTSDGGSVYKYKNGSGDCSTLKALITGSGTVQCNDTPPYQTSQRVFGPTNATFGSTTLTWDNNWTDGTHVCFVLILDKPTQNASPASRFSQGECVTVSVGKTPYVQIWGGDLKVGRFFSDESPSGRAGVYTSHTEKRENNNTYTTYGSWVEYGIFAPGQVSWTASLSGLHNGFPSPSRSSQSQWADLTFANTDNEFGYFTELSGMSGSIPDVIPPLRALFPVVKDLSSGDSLSFNGSMKSGLYQSGGSLDLGSSIIKAGKSYILDASNSTVRITGNIKYEDTDYANIDEIPQLVIIAKNISINESVTNIDAWLIAKGGTINTCNNSDKLTTRICELPLRINGPVMARDLDLRRTAGAMGGDSDEPAEIINLPASVYLWANNIDSSGLRIQTTYSVELPPYF